MSGRLNTPVNQTRGGDTNTGNTGGEIQIADQSECQTGVRVAGRAVLASMECLFSSDGFHSCAPSSKRALRGCYQANNLRNLNSRKKTTFATGWGVNYNVYIIGRNAKIGLVRHSTTT